ncbi:hypothetical protein [Bradyrhizobium cenepequi]|uniref:hypothetical protein n=1 Tax=Bradyrhizobium cenepequi TaxID=2821403 RepID=UPI001CE31435|nr:hypothetical protein [Bradyrhizobium cenepequi]
MTALNSYSTGTVSISDGDTVIVGNSTIWSAVNARPGDRIIIDGSQDLAIKDVVDSSHLSLWSPWTGGNKSGVSYTIIQESPQRFAGATAMASVDAMTRALNTDGFYWFVAPDLTEPDPSYGEEDQFAFQASTKKLWLKTGGVWVFQGVYKGLNLRGQWDADADYDVGDAVSRDGSSFAALQPNTNQTPPNAAYWQVLAAKGDPGTDGTDGVDGTAATVTVGTTTTGAPGTAANVTNSGTSLAAVLDFTIPTGKGYGGSSTTSLAIGTGSKTFTTQTGLAYTNGARVRATATAGATGWLEGVATYSGTTLTITADKSNGSGTGTAWNLNASGEPGAGDLSSANNLSDVASAATALGNLGAKFGQCRLTKSGANLVLSPRDGNLLTVNGVACTIPDAGISLAPTGLSAATFYYIYASASAGAVNALEASTSAPAVQAGTGVKIKTGDATRTLVGAAYTDTGLAWADTDGKLWVLSYFNRRQKRSKKAYSANRSTSSDTPNELNTEIRTNFITWSDETVGLYLLAHPSVAAPSFASSIIAVDSTSAQFDQPALLYHATAGVNSSASYTTFATGLTEAATHFTTMLGRAVGAVSTATWEIRTELQAVVMG